MANRTFRNKNSKFRTTNKGSAAAVRVNRNKRKPGPSARVGGGIKKTPLKSKMQDARQKIQQKKRKSVVDAREILAGMAKTQDARAKINKIRGNRSGGSSLNRNVTPIGSNILRKTDRNGKISLVTNKTKPTTSLNMAIQKQLGLVSPPKKVAVKRQLVHKDPYAMKNVLADYDYHHPSPLHSLRAMDSVYKWSKPAMSAASQVINSLEARRRALDEQLLGSDRWPRFTVTRGRSREYIDLDEIEDEEMPLVQMPRQTITLQGSSRISNVHSRLDSLPLQPETHGILAQPKTKVVVPAGHRIVVSNLQSTVSQDDIKELFEDIGQLLAARLVRPGVAEVIYKNLKDAQKAVDTYHNRQLDGQPMKCLLVNKRPLNNPTAPPLTKVEGFSISRY